MVLKAGTTMDEAPVKPVTVLLELALYKRYMRLGNLYESGVIYRMTKEQAVILLAEHDNGKPLWKVYRPAKEMQTVTMPKTRSIVDATSVKVQSAPVEHDPTVAKQDRIEIGNDEEIASLLEKGEVVTV